MVDELYDLDQIARDLEVPAELLEALVAHEIILPSLAGASRRVTAIEVDRVRVAFHLVEVMGVNLEGVEVALRMRERLIEAHRALERLAALVREVEERNDGR